MNRYEKTFAELQNRNRIALVPFAVAGDPDIAISEKVLKTYIDSGADILEIGYPFSDPMADGPVNQRAAQRAIQAGLNPAGFFAMIARVRAYSNIPFGLLLYANTILHIGIESFCKKAAAAGIDSILVADMPPEEAYGLRAAMRAHKLRIASIVSELTSAERMRAICAHTDAFIYVVSRLGPTGVQKDFSASASQTIRRLRAVTDLPLCVGFGISTPQHVAAVRDAGADGAIVGSKLVSIIEHEREHPRALLQSIGTAVRQLRAATDKKNSAAAHRFA